MYSMTGYGKAEYSQNNLDISVEIKTVNNRNFDFNAKMPRAFICLEDKIRKTVAAKVNRGRVDLFLRYSDHRESSATIEVDINKAKEYYSIVEGKEDEQEKARRKEEFIASLDRASYLVYQDCVKEKILSFLQEE